MRTMCVCIRLCLSFVPFGLSDVVLLGGHCIRSRQDFVGEPDDVLSEVLKLLRHLATLDDVRPALREMFQLLEQLSPMRRQLLGNEPELGNASPSTPRSRL